jgi:hypothetical protein
MPWSKVRTSIVTIIRRYICNAQVRRVWETDFSLLSHRARQRFAFVADKNDNAHAK